MADKLTDGDAGRSEGERYALCVLFLATRYDQFAATLARFNAVLPTPDLQRAERRAKHLARRWPAPRRSCNGGACPWSAAL